MVSGSRLLARAPAREVPFTSALPRLLRLSMVTPVRGSPSLVLVHAPGTPPAHAPSLTAWATAKRSPEKKKKKKRKKNYLSDDCNRASRNSYSVLGVGRGGFRFG